MHTMLNVVVMVQTKYIQQWCPLAIYLGDAEDKRKKHGEEREREEKKGEEAPYKGKGARALRDTLAPKEKHQVRSVTVVSEFVPCIVFKSTV